MQRFKLEFPHKGQHALMALKVNIRESGSRKCLPLHEALKVFLLFGS